MLVQADSGLYRHVVNDRFPRTATGRPLREALGHYASGITVITSHIDGEPIGFTCQSFYSVSMNPPLVSFSVMSSSGSYPKIRQAGRFAVDILSEKQVKDFQPVRSARHGQVARNRMAGIAAG